MKITHIETLPVLVPINPKVAIRSSRGIHTVSPFLFLRLHTDEGIIGLGEVSGTLEWSGEDHVTAVHIIRRCFEPLLVGRNPLEIEKRSSELQECVAGNFFTKAGIEMALWDIIGKVAGLPLYRLFGGPVRDHVPLKFSVSGLVPDAAAEIAAWAVQQGFKTLKVKVGTDPDQDVARVKAVRSAIGHDIRLGVDANGGWSPRTAIATIRRLYEYGIYFVEQPVKPYDPAWLADVRRNIEIPVLADESVNSTYDAMALVRAGAADVFSIYVGKGAGLGTARKIAVVAEAAGLGCTVGSNLELGVASAAMIHLAMATSGVHAEDFPCDILCPFLYEHDLLIDPLDIVDGRARPSERPGLGVELDDTQIARFLIA